jgi:regulator of sigma E protease
MEFLQKLLAFFLTIGPLVVIHELGHYWVARWCGVKVLRFSVGLGNVVWSRRFGKDQTEWAISALPLGGYVKMLDAREGNLDDLPASDLAREFTRQNVWKRIAIVAAGPLANFLLAIAVLTALFMHGVPEPATRLRAVLEQTSAHQAGLLGGDTVLAVNGNPVAGWSEMSWELMQAVLKQKPTVELQLERAGSVQSGTQLDISKLTLKDLETDFPAKLGLEMARPPAMLNQAVPGGPADKAGMRAGDKVLSFNGRKLIDALDFVEAIRAAPGKTVVLAGIGLDGQEFSRQVQVDNEKGIGKIKIELSSSPQMVVVQQNFFKAASKGVERTWNMSAMTLKMLGKMITGEASLRNITGPFTIAKYADQSVKMGSVSFLTFIAFVSISLGVMNLLPVPVLDGGFLLYYSLEVLMGRPLPERVSDIAQRIGLGLLLMLMVLAISNDFIGPIP